MTQTQTTFARDAYYAMWHGGNQWSAWVAYLSFFRHVAKLPLDYSKWQHWETLAEVSGPRCVHQKFCMISDRPEVLLVDDQNRPHCDTGPFCRWRDGSALYAVHGVRVPWWIIEHPEKITMAVIDKEANAEVRRVMLNRFGVERYLIESGTKPVHSDDYGTLYRREVPGDEPIVMVKVVNSTAEPCEKCGGSHEPQQLYDSDGGPPLPMPPLCQCGADPVFKDYYIRVNPELRPMLANGTFGEPQAMTARNAVASTFGKRGPDYAPCVET